MSVGRSQERWWRSALPVPTLAALVLAVLAYRADLASPTMGHWGATADVGVGLAFVAAGVLSACPPSQRLLVSLVGHLWLLASLLPVQPWHQPALVLALLTFPRGRAPRSPRTVVVLALAVVLALGLVQAGIAVVLALAAALLLPTPARRRSMAGAWPPYPATAALAVAAVLGGTAVLATGGAVPDARAALAAYQGVLVLVAAGHVLATVLPGRRSRRRVDAVLAAHLDGGQARRADVLEVLLSEALGDPGLRLLMPADGSAVTTPERSDLRWRPVLDDGRPVAAIGRTAGRGSPRSDRVADDAVRLLARSLRLQAERDDRLAELVTARRRLAETEQDRRTWLAARLATEVVAPLEAVLAELEPPGARTGTAELRIVADELRAAAGEIVGLVHGVPPTTLGDGALGDALAELAARSPVPVTLGLEEGAAGDEAGETTLYFACAEALTNVAKHAGATRVEVTLTTRGDRLVLTVRDDGRGGADPTGAGLTGLADRLAARGGRVTVDSPPGAGTTVRAEGPSRSSPTDRPPAGTSGRR